MLSYSQDRIAFHRPGGRAKQRRLPAQNNVTTNRTGQQCTDHNSSSRVSALISALHEHCSTQQHPLLFGSLLLLLCCRYRRTRQSDKRATSAAAQQQEVLPCVHKTCARVQQLDLLCIFKLPSLSRQHILVDGRKKQY